METVCAKFRGCSRIRRGSLVTKTTPFFFVFEQNRVVRIDYCASFCGLFDSCVAEYCAASFWESRIHRSLLVSVVAVDW